MTQLGDLTFVAFEDLGGNACGCGGTPVVCRVLSNGLAPPEPIVSAP